MINISSFSTHVSLVSSSYQAGRLASFNAAFAAGPAQSTAHPKKVVVQIVLDSHFIPTGSGRRQIKTQEELDRAIVVITMHEGNLT